MANKPRDSFAFIVIAYNHEEYILEHLESIKFQVVTYGANLDVDVIVNDDCSQDKTRALIDRWFATNRDLFKNVEFIYNPKNLGTSASVANALDHMTTARCKLTAGDDVYSYENIFDLSHCAPDVSMLTGRVLYLYGSDVQFHAFSNHFETATQAVYEKAVPLYRFKHYSFTNAPNLVYSVKCLMDRKVRDYLKLFDVVEDWPIQVAIAREYPALRVELIDNVLVYYRRTKHSTYIVANERFLQDKERVYDDLITAENGIIEKLRLLSRKKALRRKASMVSRLINIDTYFFILSVLTKAMQIYRRTKNHSIDLFRHRDHYMRIRQSAQMCCQES
jgi:glycosyltransferase involved in cell wall biosynthesis